VCHKIYTEKTKCSFEIIKAKESGRSGKINHSLFNTATRLAIK